MLDGVASEERGRPAAVVVTQPFAGYGRAVAAMKGLANLSLIVIRHPLASATREWLREEARRVIPEVMASWMADREGEEV